MESMPDRANANWSTDATAVDERDLAEQCLLERLGDVLDGVRCLDDAHRGMGSFNEAHLLVERFRALDAQRRSMSVEHGEYRLCLRRLADDTVIDSRYVFDARAEEPSEELLLAQHVES